MAKHNFLLPDWLLKECGGCLSLQVSVDSFSKKWVKCLTFYHCQGMWEEQGAGFLPSERLCSGLGQEIWSVTFSGATARGDSGVLPEVRHSCSGPAWREIWASRVTQITSAHALLEQMKLLGASPARSFQFFSKNQCCFSSPFTVVASLTSTCPGRKVICSFFFVQKSHCSSHNGQ